MTDYFIRQTKPNQYEIAKFDELRSSPPEQFYTYRVIGDTCTCPSYKIPCKHIRLIHSWLGLKKPEEFFYRDTADTFLNHGFANIKPSKRALKKKPKKPIRKTLKP